MPAHSLDQKKIKFEVSELLVRYVPDLLDVDNYEHFPSDYEAKLRRNIEEHLNRAGTPSAKRERMR